MKRREPTTGDALLHALCSDCSPFRMGQPDNPTITDAVFAIAYELSRIADCMEADRKPKKARKP